MSGIIPPWPPADPSEPQPFDQRGSCWPMGPCTVKLPTRLEVIGTSPAGPLNDAWSYIKTGQLMLIDPSISTKGIAWYLGQYNSLLFPNTLKIVYDETVPELWYAHYFGYIPTLTGPPPHCKAVGNMTSSFCGSDCIIPVYEANGPDIYPVYITFRWLNWWNISTYPW